MHSLLILAAQEIAEASGHPDGLSKYAPPLLLQKFWDRTALQAGAATAAGAASSATAALSGTAAPSSRYHSDFQELHQLGRGGFGVVVAAMNRLDGRQYAVKKIRLDPGGSTGSYNRILREVATLSRLQHPNVVRYFQVNIAKATLSMLVCFVCGVCAQPSRWAMYTLHCSHNYQHCVSAYIHSCVCCCVFVDAHHCQQDQMACWTSPVNACKQ